MCCEKCDLDREFGQLSDSMQELNNYITAQLVMENPAATTRNVEGLLELNDKRKIVLNKIREVKCVCLPDDDNVNMLE